MVTIDAWEGQLQGLRTSVADVEMEMATTQVGKGGSKPFLASASDGNRYWIKLLNNPQGGRVPVIEQIVARAGKLIGAPVCTVKTVEIKEKYVGWEIAPGMNLEAGIAHGSQEIKNAVENRGKLKEREKDDNSSRHAYIFALYDWCWGHDPQGLLDLSDDSKFYSHDHGLYLPPNSADFERDKLISNLDTPHELIDDEDGLNMDAVENVCQSLNAISKGKIKGVLKAIPSSWPVTDSELEAVGFFLEYRAPKVAQRLKEKFKATS